MCNKEVRPAVAVVVTKSRTRRPTRILVQPRLSGYVAERAIVVVAVEDDPAKTGDQQIGPAVIVKVSNGRPHSPAGIADTGLFRNIGKRAIVVVMEERTARFAAGQRHVDSGRIGEVNVGPAVAIIVDERHSPAHRLHDVLFRGRRKMIELDLGGARDVDQLGNLRVGRWRGRLVSWLGSGVLGSTGIKRAEHYK